MTVKKFQKEIRSLKDCKKAQHLSRFFKTGPGEYGEGDVFLGLTVPQQRQLLKKYFELSLDDLSKILKSPYHEERLTALLILVQKYKKCPELRESIFQLYKKNYQNINNWDLVDLSAEQIMGEHLYLKEKNLLVEWAHSKHLWKKRISIISTFNYIKRGESDWTFKIAKILLNDEHDLIHKAVGWMLREVGKRVSLDIEREFLKRYYQKMPRTMLRYAIERFPEQERQKYLKGFI